VNFLNDAYAGPGEDRNLYVQSIVFDNSLIAGETTIDRAGPVAFHAPAVVQAPSAVAGSSPAREAEHHPSGVWFRSLLLADRDASHHRA